jgi:hypothetical protein
MYFAIEAVAGSVAGACDNVNLQQTSTCHQIWLLEKQIKVTSHIAQYSILMIAQGALHLTSWKNCSIYLGFSGKHPADSNNISINKILYSGECKVTNKIRR